VSIEPNPHDNPDLFDSVELAGVKSPGVVKLSGHDDKTSWDVKAGSGQAGASLTRKGTPPVEFTATFYLATSEEQDAWAYFRDVIKSSVAGTTKALDIYHPDLEANGIKSVVKGTIGGVVHDGKGGQTIAVKFQVYAPPVKAAGSPSGSASKAKREGKTVVDPNAAANAELAALTAQYQATPWGTL